MTRSSSSQVRRAEQQLRAAGYRNVKVDGHLTAGERHTLATVQAARGLHATGKLDAATRRDLGKLAAWKGRDEFVVGQKSKAIGTAEQQLRALGEKIGKADGVLDARTAKALQAFQADQFDVSPKGRLDRQTSKALKAAHAGRHATPQEASQRAEALLLGHASGVDAEDSTEVTRDGINVNAPEDTERSSKRHRAAATEVARNHAVEKKALAGLPAEDQAAYHSARAALKKQNDPVAALALQKLLFDGKFAGSLGAQLGALANGSAPLAAGVKRRELLADLVQECATPTAINQGPVGSCGPTSVAIDLALRDPAEYARLAIGVAGPSGSVAMHGGMPLVRPPGTEKDDGSGRSTVQRMLGSAMYEITNGDATYQGIGDNSGSWFGPMSTLLSQLHGRPFEGSWLPTPDAKQAGLRCVDEMLANGQRPIVGLDWPTPDKGHFLTVTGHEGGFVSLINPWGREERISESLFLSRFRSALYDPAVVSDANRSAMKAGYIFIGGQSGR